MKKVYLIATIVAIITGFATYLFAVKLEEKTTIEDAPSTFVVVAVVEIPEKTIITKDMITLKQLPVISVTPGAAITLEEVVGKINNYPAVVGEQLVVDKLGQDESKTLSLEIEEGKYAYTIPVDLIAGTAGFLSQGDTVDILLTTTKDSATTTEIIIEDLKIMRISTFAAEYGTSLEGAAPITGYGEITLHVTKQEALELTLAQSNGVIRPLLKTRAEEEVIVDEPDVEEQAETPPAQAS